METFCFVATLEHPLELRWWIRADCVVLPICPSDAQAYFLIRARSWVECHAVIILGSCYSSYVYWKLKLWSNFSDVFTLPALVLGDFFVPQLSSQGPKALFIREGAMCPVECLMERVTILKKKCRSTCLGRACL